MDEVIEADVTENLMITIGSIGAPFGVRGWVHVNSFTSPAENIARYDTWYLPAHHLQNWQPVQVLSKRHHQSVVAQINGCTDRDAAALWRGKLIAVPRIMLPKLAENEYYWTDLVGLKVTNPEGEHIGEVDHLYETGANDVIVIKNLSDGTKQHVPFLLNDVVVSVSLEAQCIVIDWVEA